MARTLEELEEDAELLEDRLYEDLAERTDLFYVIDGKYYRFELHVTVVEITDEEELQILRN